MNCSNCGQKIAIPDGHSRPKIRCGMCGYYVAVPAEMRQESQDDKSDSEEKTYTVNKTTIDEKPKAARAKVVSASAPQSRSQENPAADQHARRAKPNNNPDDHRPNFESDQPAGEYLLKGDVEERDDDQTTPYAVPGTGLKKCPDCRGDLPLDAVLCVHCGVEFETKSKKAKREFTPLYREWESFVKFDIRMKIFIGMQIFNVMSGFFFYFVGGAFTSLFGMLFQTALQAFLIGTFDKLIVKRTAKGKADLEKHWRVCFITFKVDKIDWKVSHGTAIVASHDISVFDWMIMVYLLFCGIVPGLLFYWFCLKPERFEVVLCDVHGSTDFHVFKTTNRDTTDEICRTISEVTTLAYRPVV
jgi:hypothetical protein